MVTRTTIETYTDGDIAYGAITQGSHLPPTENNTQCTTYIFPCYNTLSFIGSDAHPSLGVWLGFLTTNIHHPNLKSFILSYSSRRTGVMEEYISSYHYYRLGILRITVLMISTYFLRDYIGLLWKWSIFFTILMVVWSSAFMTAFL